AACDREFSCAMAKPDVLQVVPAFPTPNVGDRLRADLMIRIKMFRSPAKEVSQAAPSMSGLHVAGHRQPSFDEGLAPTTRNPGQDDRGFCPYSMLRYREGHHLRWETSGCDINLPRRSKVATNGDKLTINCRMK